MGPHSAWIGLWADDLEPGTAKDRQRQPSVKLIDYKPSFSRSKIAVRSTRHIASAMEPTFGD
jgi:hypothetical protein